MANPEKYLAKLAGQDSEVSHKSVPQMDLPPIGIPQLIEPEQHSLPRLEPPPATIEETIENNGSSAPSAKRADKSPKEVVR